MKWRRLNNAVHRDLGYFFTGMIIIYALSGIALNHRNDWNPNYSITNKTLELTVPSNLDTNEEETYTICGVLESEPEGLFDDVAVMAIKEWHFHPAQYQGQAVKVWAKQKIRFDLN